MSKKGKRRAFGQHFLKDSAISDEIVQTALKEAAANDCRQILEIGPGKGALTLPLLEYLPDHKKIESLVLVEKDEALGTRWAETHSLRPYSVQIADFLDLAPEKWILKPPVAVMANLPYSSSVAILKKLNQFRENIPVMVLMFQAEVSKRLRAEIGTRDCGSLSIYFQNLWEIKKLLGVPPKSFNPPPQVNSEVVVLKRKSVPLVPGSIEDEALWEEFLRQSFLHRRKMLRSAFPWKNALEQTGVDDRKRPEALQWHEWISLFQFVRQMN